MQIYHTGVKTNAVHVRHGEKTACGFPIKDKTLLAQTERDITCQACKKIWDAVPAR